MTDRGVSRREYVIGAVLAGGVTALAGCNQSNGSDDTSSRSDRDGEPSPDAGAGLRMETADFASGREFEGDTYQRIHATRKRRAVETLLADPEVQAIVDDWVGGFEAYEVLTNRLETVSIQGPTGLSVTESGFPDGEEGTFDVTAENRQTVYGIVDRRRDELVALEVTDPQDVSWTVTQSPYEMALGQAILETDVVSETLGDVSDLEWYPSWKGASGSYTGLGQADLPHGSGGSAVLHVVDGDAVRIVSALIDGSDPERPALVDVSVLDHAVEYPLYELVETVQPAPESVLEAVPDVPTELRPYYTANEGFHRMEPPEESFERDGWEIEWEPTSAHGASISASYQGSPVFEALDTPVTFTGYYMPPRDGRNSYEWYFPDEDTVFSGDLLFWDVHSDEFGGPGMLGRLDFPARGDAPSGFQLKTHYHSSAIGRESVDFHSGLRFGPYNYDIGYEFYRDGVLSPIFRRAGPGFLTHFTEKFHENADTYDEGGSYDPPVVQHYVSAQAIDVTPGTDDGVTVELFDGDEWTTPDTEFYLEGESGTIARFRNPDGPETIDIPLRNDLELVVVRRDESEIGPGEYPAHRLSQSEPPFDFAHPAQYVDGQSIQDERLVAWLLMLGPIDQLPYPSGLSNFVTSAEMRLSGY